MEMLAKRNGFTISKQTGNGREQYHVERMSGNKACPHTDPVRAAAWLEGYDQKRQDEQRGAEATA